MAASLPPPVYELPHSFARPLVISFAILLNSKLYFFCFKEEGISYL
ncbi:hypothetical protein THOB06_10455 [Vibrio rotiferianus]|nr:hypothetical protein THOG10_10454 [Vibrio rotiferianus]CAH1557910.1 hypothetical protein THOB06_10455 [Vibrio rotiferianus]